MDWLVFTYSLPSGTRSSPRVTLWRRLRRLGAVAVAGGAQVLPARETCREAFMWLAQEVRRAGGDALIMSVNQVSGITDSALVALFQQARAQEYEALSLQIKEFTLTLPALDAAPHSLQRLRRQYDAIARNDYFACPIGARVAAELEHLAQSIAPAAPPLSACQAHLEAYRDKSWVTRPHLYVDRMACIWFIRRYINPKAEIRYALLPKVGEISFDMDGADFTHQGQLCSFEVFLRTFALDELALLNLAEIVHEIDLHDETCSAPEIAGVERLVEGWARSGLTDTQLAAYGTLLFDGLYQGFAPPSD